VHQAFPSMMRSILTEIYLCHACSCQEILRVETPGQVSLSGGAVGLSNVAGGESIAAIRAALARGVQAELATFRRYGDAAEVAQAIRAAIMWNTVWLPAERGPITPVDRSWQLSKGPHTPDWAYTLFQWDNQFARSVTAVDEAPCSL
jgi:hypothetical protein